MTLSSPRGRRRHGQTLPGSGLRRCWPGGAHGLPGRDRRDHRAVHRSDPVATPLTLLVAVGNLIGPARMPASSRSPIAPAQRRLRGPDLEGRQGISSSTPGWMLRQVDPLCRDAHQDRPLLRRGPHLQRPRRPRGKSRSRDGAGSWTISGPGRRGRAGQAAPGDRAGARLVPKRMGETNSLSRAPSGLGQREPVDADEESPTRATGAHVSEIAHVTQQELRAHLTETSGPMGSGTGSCSRLVQRSKAAPRWRGRRRIILLAPLVEELRRVDGAEARTFQVMRRDEVARRVGGGLSRALPRRGGDGRGPARPRRGPGAPAVRDVCPAGPLPGGVPAPT